MSQEVRVTTEKLKRLRSEKGQSGILKEAALPPNQLSCRANNPHKKNENGIQSNKGNEKGKNKQDKNWKRISNMVTGT